MNKLRQISYGVETDPVILAIIPEIAHAMCGESKPDKMTASQKRKARNIAPNVKKTLIRAGIVRDGQIY